MEIIKEVHLSLKLICERLKCVGSQLTNYIYQKKQDQFIFELSLTVLSITTIVYNLLNMISKIDNEVYELNDIVKKLNNVKNTKFIYVKFW